MSWYVFATWFILQVLAAPDPEWTSMREKDGTPTFYTTTECWSEIGNWYWYLHLKCDQALLNIKIEYLG